MPRQPLWSAFFAALLLAPAAARADVSIPGERIVASEVVVTGLLDFPAYHFVLAMTPLPPDYRTPEGTKLPAPALAREGEPISASTIYFQELRAIPADAPQPVTDAWLASSQAPTSGRVTRRPLRVPIASGERVARAHYRVRQVRAGWISTELLSVVAVMADGSERPLARPIPQTYEIVSMKAPPGWQLFLMADPSWPRTEPALPVVPCAAGDLLPLSPGPLTLVAVQGTVGPDGSVESKPFVAWGHHLDAWSREGVFPDSAAVAQRIEIEVEVEPGRPLRVTIGELYQDAQGRWFYDEEARVDLARRPRWWWWAGGAAFAALAAGTWALRRRLRRGRENAAPPRG